MRYLLFELNIETIIQLEDIHCYFNVLHFASSKGCNLINTAQINMASALSDHSVDMNSDSIEDVSATMNDENSLQNDYEPLFEVEEDEDCGRYLIADQKINQGQIILFEKPTGIYLYAYSIFVSIK